MNPAVVEAAGAAEAEEAEAEAEAVEAEAEAEAVEAVAAEVEVEAAVQVAAEPAEVELRAPAATYAASRFGSCSSRLSRGRGGCRRGKGSETTGRWRSCSGS